MLIPLLWSRCESGREGSIGRKIFGDMVPVEMHRRSERDPGLLATTALVGRRKGVHMMSVPGADLQPCCQNLGRPAPKLHIGAAPECKGEIMFKRQLIAKSFNLRIKMNGSAQ